MLKPICILLYEDKPDYAASFKLLAAKQRIIVEDFDNADSIFEALEGNPRKHRFVVLDARAYLHEGQTQGSENEANLHILFREIQRIGKLQDRVIPFCINTGFAEIKLTHEEVIPCPIFEKGNEDELIKNIWSVYNDSDAAKLRVEYSELFEFADKYFDAANMEMLSSILHKEKFKSNGIVERVQNLATLRRLVEHTMDLVLIHHLNSQSGIVQRNSTRTSDVINYLNNNGTVPTHVFGAVINILKVSSNYGSHTPEASAKIEDYPTENSLMGLTFGFFEIISWTKKLLN